MLFKDPDSLRLKSILLNAWTEIKLSHKINTISLCVYPERSRGGGVPCHRGVGSLAVHVCTLSGEGERVGYLIIEV